MELHLTGGGVSETGRKYPLRGCGQNTALQLRTTPFGANSLVIEGLRTVKNYCYRLLMERGDIFNTLKAFCVINSLVVVLLEMFNIT